MAVSVVKAFYGPLWPLGIIVVGTSGTPVGIMSLVDAGSYNAPETASTAGGLDPYPQLQAEYANCAAYDVIITPMKSVGPVVANTGSIYVVMYPLRTGSGAGNKTDSGAIVLTIPPINFASTGAPQPYHLSTCISGFQSKFNPYNLYLDADNSADGALVTLMI
jgi:hypothetical protein